MVSIVNVSRRRQPPQSATAADIDFVSSSLPNEGDRRGRNEARLKWSKSRKKVVGTGSLFANCDMAESLHNAV